MAASRLTTSSLSHSLSLSLILSLSVSLALSPSPPHPHTHTTQWPFSTFSRPYAFDLSHTVNNRGVKHNSKAKVIKSLGSNSHALSSHSCKCTCTSNGWLLFLKKKRGTGILQPVHKLPLFLQSSKTSHSCSLSALASCSLLKKSTLNGGECCAIG